MEDMRKAIIDEAVQERWYRERFVRSMSLHEPIVLRDVIEIITSVVDS